MSVSYTHLKTVDVKETQRIHRIQRFPYDARMIDNVNDAEDREHHEVSQHDRPEQRPDLRRATRLDREDPDQDRERVRHDIGLEALVDITEPLGRREHRHRRRDHAVAIEQRGREHPEQDLSLIHI